MRPYFSAGICALAALVLALPAVARPVVQLHLSAAVVARTASGEKISSAEHTVLRSGQVLRYTIEASNSGTDPAFDLTPIGKVPARTVFVPGSVRPASTNVEYSLDGKSFSLHPTIKVRQPDGKVINKPADPTSFTAVRWRMSNPLPPHKAVSFSFEVRVK